MMLSAADQTWMKATVAVIKLFKLLPSCGSRLSLAWVTHATSQVFLKIWVYVLRKG